MRRSERPHHRSAVAALLWLVALAGPARSEAQTAGYEPAAATDHAFPLTIESIMRGPELIGQSPVGVRWSDDGEWVYFRWREDGAVSQAPS